MPELPEVETVRRTLKKLVVGKMIKEVHVSWAKIIKQPDDWVVFAAMLQGQTIHDIERRGKFLIFELDQHSLVSHLRMEGKYGLFQNEDPIDKHTHVIFMFTDNTELRYKDVRKFGTMHLVEKGQEQHLASLSQLGPEPFSNTFTIDQFEKSLKKTNRKIKVALLDQKIVVGLGNIYVDEALFRSNIHPERMANSLQYQEVELLFKMIKETLAEAIEKGGSTIRSYVNSQGQIGTFQLSLFVYGKENQPCQQCGTIIEKIKVGGRGTHYCPNCQK